MRDAFFVNSQSDYDAVTAHLVRRGMKPEDAEQLGRRFYVKRVRRVVPKPSELAHRVESVYRVFTGKGTAKHGLLFKDGKDGTAAVHANVMDIILGGYASDFSNDLYNECSVDQHGLQQYTCSRGSSPLEGFHFHLRSCIPGSLPQSALVGWLSGWVCVQGTKLHQGWQVRVCKSLYTNGM